MKEKDELEKLFERLSGDFDFESPNKGHQKRFLEKIERQNGVVTLKRKKNWWKPLSIAASIVLLVGIGLFSLNQQDSIEERVVEISPEISNTEFYFASLVEEQVRKLEEEKTPANAKLVEDTLGQLKQLENDYKQLELDLVNGGNSEIILNAMIINFQTRIDLLKEVLASIEDIKNINLQNDENFTI
ncbi:hypothetical protein GCM10011414_28320 [Croceivirga lutea]|uniref:hypothetical protein n=1 Tax=Croceivirga lutea TaxID=1775167 RepID=UPI00163A1269|nr:hypothetical protein [Croceivirga lutea]GGG56805.1 hypothetical protein GCM10011414_28320 [Croceivirga lutea]